jgi:hypothetical protein
MTSRAGQLDLFAATPRSQDEAALMRVLVRAASGKPEPKGAMVGRMSRAAIRRLMTPLPPITVPRG